MKQMKSFVCLALVAALAFSGYEAAQAEEAGAPYVEQYEGNVEENASDEAGMEETGTPEKIAITRKNFKDLTAYVKTKDTNQDGYLSADENRSIFYLENDVDKDGKADVKVNGLEGIENLPYVRFVALTGFTGKKITLPKKSLVTSIRFYRINTKSLTINAPGVKQIKMYHGNGGSMEGKLKAIDISKCDSLMAFANNYCTDKITTLKLPKAKSNLRSLSLCDLKLSTLNLSQYKNLQEVTILRSSVKSLNMGQCKKLLYAYFYCCPNLTSVNASKAAELRYLNWYDCKALRISAVKTAGKGEIRGGEGTYWSSTKKYQEFFQSLNS